MREEIREQLYLFKRGDWDSEDILDNILKSVKEGLLKKLPKFYCLWCGKTYGEHRDEPFPDGAAAKTPCGILKTGFDSNANRYEREIKELIESI